MPDEPPLRRTVRDFIKHYGLSRDQYLVDRNKAKVRPKGWDAVLSAKDETALLEHLSAERRSEQVFQHIRERQSAVTTQFAPPPPPPIDYEAEVERVSKSLDKWRGVLKDFARGHVADDRTQRCKRCHAQAPRPTKRTLHRLDNDLVERVAVADSGDPADGLETANQPNDVQPELTLGQLYEARNRWRRALVDLTIDHMIEDSKGHCAQCPKETSCDISKVVTRINKGIARQIEDYACMDDGQRELALGERPVIHFYEDDDWDAM